jgi:hypothetical protein
MPLVVDFEKIKNACKAESGNDHHVMPGTGAFIMPV